jgi:hypothetical protein
MSQYTFSFNDALKQGYTPDQINQFLAQQQKQGDSYVLTDTPQATPQQSQQPAQPAQPKSNGFADWLPTIGGIAGGVLGGFVPGLGETGVSEVGGAAIGQAGGQALKDVITGQPIGADVAEQGAAGALGGVTGLGVGKLAGSVLSKLGEGEAINGLNLTRLQQNALKVKNGEPVANTLTNHGLIGTNAEGLTNGINKVQSTFDSIAKNNNVPINQDALLSRGVAAIQALKNSSVPSDQALASQVDEALGNVMDKIANGKVTSLADLNAERQAFDNATKDSQFGSSSWGTNRIVGDILRNTAYDTADVSSAVGPNGESLQQLGQNLRKLYNISNIAEKRVGQGNSAGPLSLSNMLLGGLGATAGSIGGPAGSVAGFAAATGARQALANPTVAKVLSNTLTGAGKASAAPIGMGVATGLGAGAAGALPVSPQGATNNQDNTNNQSSNFQSNTLPSSPQASNNSTIQSSQSQALPASPTSPAASNPLAGYTINGKPIDAATANLIKQVADYKIDPTKISSLKNEDRQRLVSLASQYDPTYDSSSFPAKAAVAKDFTSGKSAQNIRSLNTAVSHLNALAEAGGALGNTSFTPLNTLKNSVSQSTGQPQVVRFNDALNAVAGEMATVFKGTSGTDEEINSWKQQMSASQSPAQIQAGINQMVELMAGRLQALQSQYQTGMGKQANFSFLNPNSQAILQKWGIDPTQLANPDSLPANP